ncbi:MAG: PilZ domain-containing protein [Alphaproteobacteria bacterium]
MKTLQNELPRSDLPHDDRRAHQRVPVNMLGRYMLPDHNEYACHTINMSPSGLAISSPVRGQIGDRVILYLDHVGRVDGQTTRVFNGGFAVHFNTTKRKRERLAEQLTWLTNQAALGLSDSRAQKRDVPKNPSSVVTTDTGQTISCSIIDMSLTGASLRISHDFSIGDKILLGRSRGRVVRATESGVAIEFIGIPLMVNPSDVFAAKKN